MNLVPELQANKCTADLKGRERGGLEENRALASLLHRLDQRISEAKVVLKMYLSIRCGIMS